MTAPELREALIAKIVTDVRELKNGDLEILFAGEKDGLPLVAALTVPPHVLLDTGH